MYSTAATPDHDTFVPQGPKPIFIQSRDIPRGVAQPSGEELYKSIGKTIPHNDITGIQRIGALWRIYLESHESRVQLITRGLTLRDIAVPVYDTNPFTKAKSDHLTKLTIKDIPLSVSDELITTAIQKLKGNIRGDMLRQKLRVSGQLTNCLNGDRVCYIDPPTQPLPRQIIVANLFRARLFHIGQPEQTSTCTKCLETGHVAFQCKNAVKCRSCKQTGHVSSSCTLQAQITDELRTARSNTETHHVIPTQKASTDSAATTSSNTDHNILSADTSSSTSRPARGNKGEANQPRKPIRQVDISDFLRQPIAIAKSATVNETTKVQHDESNGAESDDDTSSDGSDSASDDTEASTLSPETPTPPKQDKAAKKRKRKKLSLKK